MGVKTLEATKDVYHKALKKVTLFGQTIFSDIINEVADSVRVKFLTLKKRYILIAASVIVKIICDVE